jgi:hypothetical protein
VKLKHKKFLAKQVLGAVFALAIGYLVKYEHSIEDRIDEHYDAKKTDQENN